MKIEYNVVKLRVLKAEHNVNNQDLARVLQVSVNTITKKMSGKVSLTAKEIETLCNTYSIDPNYFFNITNNLK